MLNTTSSLLKKTLFLAYKMKDKFSSWRFFYPKFSQQQNTKCLTEKRTKNCQNKQFSFFQFYSFHCSSYALFTFSAHSPSMPQIHSIPLLFMWSLGVDNGNYLRSTIISDPFLGIIAMWGSFAVGDHLRCCPDLMSLITSSLVTTATAVIHCRNVRNVHLE